MELKTRYPNLLPRLVSLSKFLEALNTTTRHLEIHIATMGWFWGSPDNKDGNKSQDPLRDLDPSLREFLAKESPVKYSSSNPPSTSPVPVAPKPPQSAQASESRNPNPTPESDATKENKVPAASLYQDGRYAELWKTYQSQSETEAAGKSDQEKINDVLEGYKYRKAEIGRAALENCALEQWDVNECFRNVSWSRTLNMCRTENRKLERCYLMQSVCCSINFSVSPGSKLADSSFYRNSSKH